jgi:hypothetical protein
MAQQATDEVGGLVLIYGQSGQAVGRVAGGLPIEAQVASEEGRTRELVEQGQNLVILQSLVTDVYADLPNPDAPA